MKYVLVIFWCCFSQSHAELPTPHLLSESLQPAKSTAAVILQPLKLSADWWRYFDVHPGELQTRIDDAMQQLEKVVQNFPDDQKPEVNAKIKVIGENLRTLQTLRNEKETQESTTPAVLEKYSLKQWLDIDHKRRALQAELESVKEDLQRNEARIKTVRQRFDTLTASYLALTESSLEKAVQGVAVISAWTDWAVSTEQLRLQKSELAVEKAQIQQLSEEAGAAEKRLFLAPEEIQQLKQETDAALNELNAAHEKSLQVENVTVSDISANDQDKALALLNEQQVRHVRIKEAVADLLFTRKKVELALAQILISAVDINLNALRKELKSHLDKITETATRLDIWREELEREQGRVGMSLATLLAASTKQDNNVIKLTRQRLSEVQDSLLSLQRLDSEIHDAHLVANRLATLITDREGRLKSGLESVKTSSVKVWELTWEKLRASLFKIGDTPVTTIGLLTVLLIIIFSWGLSHFVRRGLIHLSEQQHGNAAFLYTLSRLAHYLILIIGISIGLSSIGVDLSNFALIAGALSLGIGFGMQAIVSNFVSGLIVLFERSLRIGDFVELSSGLAGEVRAINVRSTLVTTTDMVDILVPNSEFVNGKVINWTLTDASRRIHIPFGVAYGSDKELVRQAGLEAAQQTPYTLKSHNGREPEVWLTNFGNSSLDFELIVWVQPHAVKKPQRVRAAYYWELESALRKFGIEIPFPQRDLHIRSGLGNRPITSLDSDKATQSSPTGD